jgi:hypothetical protein
MPTQKKDQKQQGKSQLGRNSQDRSSSGQNLSDQGRSSKSDDGRSSKSGSKDRVAMNSNSDDSRKGTMASGRDDNDDFELGSRAGSGTGIHSASHGSHESHRR